MPVADTREQAVRELLGAAQTLIEALQKSGYNPLEICDVLLAAFQVMHAIAPSDARDVLETKLRVMIVELYQTPVLNRPGEEAAGK